jgi:hypothetical protein
MIHHERLTRRFDVKIFVAVCLLMEDLMFAKISFAARLMCARSRGSFDVKISMCTFETKIWGEDLVCS